MFSQRSKADIAASFDAVSSKRPKYDGNIHELGMVLEKADSAYIKQWQTYLKLVGHYAGKVDGVFGKSTQIAVTKCAWDSNCARAR